MANIHQYIPKILTTIISPFSTQDQVRNCVNELQQDERKIELLVDLANRHFLIPTLKYALVEHQLLPLFDDDFKAYLEAMSNFMSERNQAITAQCLEFLDKAHQQDLTPLLLKGASTLFNDVYPTPGLRLLSDLDIVFKRDEVEMAQTLFHNLGYTVPEQYRANKVTKKSHHLPPFYRDGDACPIELHMQAIQTQYQHYLLLDAAFEHSQTLSHESIAKPFLALSPENEIIHCFVHSQLVDKHDAFDRMNFRHMDYFVRMVMHYDEVLNWKRIQQHFKDPRDQKAFQQYIYTVNKLFNCNISIDNTFFAQSQLQLKYRNSLKSCFSEKHQFWRARHFIIDVSSVFSYSKLSASYEIPDKKTLWKIRFKRFIELVKRYKHPRRLMYRLNIARG